jgi:hypothetical protein
LVAILLDTWATLIDEILDLHDRMVGSAFDPNKDHRRRIRKNLRRVSTPQKRRISPQMETIRIRPLTESDVDLVITAAGGERAHARNRPGADYRLNEAVIELKMLDEEGLFKPERQAKLAALFRNEELNRPVIVLDRDRLPQRDQVKYDHILEGPIKTAVAKARQQLKQSRAEFPDSSCSLLFVVNNGYTALDHESLCQLIARRVRNDTTAIDGIIVAGCYFHTDGFDSYFLCPFEYVPINILSPFSSLDRLEHAWNSFFGKRTSRTVGCDPKGTRPADMGFLSLISISTPGSRRSDR